MRDEGLSLAYGVLNVARADSLETIERIFSQAYKLARRSAAGGDLRRQELNAALETLKDVDRRAAVELESFWTPLDRTRALPSKEELAARLLPLDCAAEAAGCEPELLPSPSELAQTALAQVPVSEPVSSRELLMRLAARLVLEQFDPWAPPTARTSGDET